MDLRTKKGAGKKRSKKTTALTEINAMEKRRVVMKPKIKKG